MRTFFKITLSAIAIAGLIVSLSNALILHANGKPEPDWPVGPVHMGEIVQTPTYLCASGEFCSDNDYYECASDLPGGCMADI